MCIRDSTIPTHLPFIELHKKEEKSGHSLGLHELTFCSVSFIEPGFFLLVSFFFSNIPAVYCDGGRVFRGNWFYYARISNVDENGPLVRV